MVLHSKKRKIELKKMFETDEKENIVNNAKLIFESLGLSKQKKYVHWMEESPEIKLLRYGRNGY